ncbi:hypothetical protein EG028_20695 [Chitinophaga barathri]|uniref:Uncharacterized protein n=2 Tax=Chitinophaga barathri TaxID=1647451 RepID=A0A3N4M6R5_9BACT|nr:hypothetical protein EG028_20695 [Chitinophaga barathri]
MGVIPIAGTIGGITFYEMNGQYYARSKSSLSGKRVKTDPNFERTRMYSRRMGLASGTAAHIYRRLPRQERDVTFYRKMVSAGLKLLKTGCTEERLEAELKAMFQPEILAMQAMKEKLTTRKAAAQKRPESTIMKPVGEAVPEVARKDAKAPALTENKMQMPEVPAGTEALNALESTIKKQAPVAGVISVDAGGKLEPCRREISKPGEERASLIGNLRRSGGKLYSRKTTRAFVPGTKNAHARTEKEAVPLRRHFLSFMT